ncbi:MULTISPECIES: hypothetical protein [Priestia]|uniref:hypothetical protein n=1 Tax=Priestia TaxID=2800373 RepID=UPI001C8F0E6E|nr:MULTISPECIES: hypothetical protein [Priestia]MBY0077634.1 hypothetical protein [Priestia aryabhattai]MEB4884457.1 hypothetical protein [Priestia megaterium]
MGKRKTDTLIFNLENIEKEDIVIKSTDIGMDIVEAEELLTSYKDQRVEKVAANFENNKWVFKERYTRSLIMFDFNKIYESLTFEKNEEKTVLIVLKCWLAKKLNETSISIAKHKFTNITCALLYTRFLKKPDELLINLKYSKLIRINKEGQFNYSIVSNAAALIFVTDFADFLRFYNSKESIELIKRLDEIKTNLKKEKKYKKLPAFKDVLTIKSYLDYWFEEELKERSEELLKYYPLILWWNLTAIIPLRVIEFCHIDRDCLFYKEDSYYITFPRMKHDRKGIYRVISTYDTLPIPENLYNLFQHYKEISENYGFSRYLISYRAYNHYFPNHKKLPNIENYMFNYNDLNRTLASFYRNILHKRFKININSINGVSTNSYSTKLNHTVSFECEDSKGKVETLIKAGDLRHIAIINMMMQGYDKVEIQRLAGHITENTQYGYYNHMDSWMDTEIKKIEADLVKYRNNSSNSNNEKELAIHPSIKDFFENQNKKNYINANVKKNEEESYIKLNLGYCTDESMPCPSANWKHVGCYFCKHWYISSDELEEKRNFISNDLRSLYKETKDKVGFLKSLFQKQLGDELNESYKLKDDLTSLSREIQEGIQRVAKLKSMLGVGEIE